MVPSEVDFKKSTRLFSYFSDHLDGKTLVAGADDQLQQIATENLKRCYKNYPKILLIRSKAHNSENNIWKRDVQIKFLFYNHEIKNSVNKAHFTVPDLHVDTFSHLKDHTNVSAVDARDRELVE